MATRIRVRWTAFSNDVHLLEGINSGTITDYDQLVAAAGEAGPAKQEVYRLSETVQFRDLVKRVRRYLTANNMGSGKGIQIADVDHAADYPVSTQIDLL